jgi:hypothetical protein
VCVWREQLGALLAKFFDVESCVDGSHFASHILHSSAVPNAARERALADIQQRRGTSQPYRLSVCLSVCLAARPLARRGVGSAQRWDGKRWDEM